MSRIEKILPVILSLALPGLNFVNNNVSMAGLGIETMLLQYVLASGFLFSLWHMNYYFMSRPVADKLGVWGTVALANIIWIFLFVLIFMVILPREFEGVNKPLPVLAFVRLVLGAMVFIVIQFGLRTQKQQERLKVQNLSLQAENLKSQLEVMKQQINPHFLFNSLNTLLDLIEDDQQKAADFVRSFSRLYRSVLQTSQQDFVLLEDELRLLENYWSLLKMRFQDAVVLEVNIAEEKKGWLIPPLSLQLLIENAVKHNQATPKKVLLIQITEEGDSLQVRNKINPRAYQQEGEGLGLRNLQQRYTLLYKPIDFEEAADEFVVTLPLKPV